MEFENAEAQQCKPLVDVEAPYRLANSNNKLND